MLLADEVYGDLAYDGPVTPIGSLDPDAPIISFSSLSKAYVAPGWRAGWMVVGRRRASTMLLGGHQEARGRSAVQQRSDASTRSRRRCSAIAAIRPHFARRCAPAPMSPRARSTRSPGSPAWPRRRLLRDAQGRAAARATPTSTTSSSCCAQRACCACMAPVSACRRRTGSSASSFWRARRTSPRSTPSIDSFTRSYLQA